VTLCGNAEPSVIEVGVGLSVYLCIKTVTPPTPVEGLIITSCGYACSTNAECDGCGEVTGWLEGNLFS